MVIKLEQGLTRAVTTKNVSAYNYFYLTGTGQTVSKYGLAGSFEASGSKVSITGEYSYHNGVKTDWTGESSTSIENDDTLCGYYDLYYNNKHNNSSEIKIKCTKKGVITVTGHHSYTEQ